MLRSPAARRHDGLVREILLGDAVLLLTDAPADESTDLISRAAGRLLGMERPELILTHSCPHCGSSDHGRPRVLANFREVAEVDACAVSFSRCGGNAIAAARTGTALGVDIDSIANIVAHPVDEVLLHPAEREALRELSADDRDRRLARLWVAKEAIAKFKGLGLRIDLRDIRCGSTGTAEPSRCGPAASACRYRRAWNSST